jgi:hypothetical protein
MNKRMFLVMQRRSELLAKISIQRDQLGDMTTHWQPALQLADRAWLAIRFMQRYPAILAGLAAIIVIRRRGVLGLIKGSWRAWLYLGRFSKML